MEELIKIDFKDGKKLVSARDLHEGLGVQGRFSRWFETYVLGYGFIENVDFVGVQKCTPRGNHGATQEIQDYALSIEVAKHVSMLQRNELGMKFRNYFIECERQLQLVSEKNQLLLGLFSDDPVVVASSHKKLVELETQPLVMQIEEQKPMVEGYETFLDADGLVTFEMCAKALGIGKNTLLKHLRDLKITQTDYYINRNGVKSAGEKNNVPYQKYMHYFSLKQVTIQNGKLVRPIIRLTTEGQEFVRRKLVEHNLI